MPAALAGGMCRGSLESWEVSVRYLYRIALIVWLAAGFAIHVYDTRTAWGFPAHQDIAAVAPAGDVSGSLVNARDRSVDVAVAYAAWAAVGFVLALRGVHLLFRRADCVADVESYLTGVNPQAN